MTSIAELEKIWKGYSWRYTWNSKVHHAIELPSSSAHIHDNSLAVCATSPAWFMGWYGTGSQEEYDRNDTLRECKKCINRMEIERAFRLANPTRRKEGGEAAVEGSQPPDDPPRG